MHDFVVNERLRADCHFICDLQLSRLLLMDDKRWQWLILVPRVDNGVEIHQLAENEQSLLQVETCEISRMLQEISQCWKINTGALGNVVRQLHIHVIARNEGDANWPAPVWGYGERQPYDGDMCNAFIRQIRDWIVKNG
jgi:diadenosine tetraphosphate (Ap4A) HIT family hydrolase